MALLCFEYWRCFLCTFLLLLLSLSLSLSLSTFQSSFLSSFKTLIAESATKEFNRPCATTFNQSSILNSEHRRIVLGFISSFVTNNLIRWLGFV
ncbi:hypothetical protein HanIR_Chr02g0084181 [Helianthus annuus]|nr:hypothetical protein HanIR_Chr02g0084181 [Helianthus annuus]